MSTTYITKTLSMRADLIIDAYKHWFKGKNKVLDIGIGNGIVAQKIQERFGCKISGTDIINYLDDRVSIPFFIMNGNRLPFQNDSFNVSMLNDVLHHCDKATQIKLLKEAKRVSKDVLIFETEPSISAYFFDYFLNKIYNPSMNIPLNFREHRQWVSIFKKLGFTIESNNVRKKWYYPLKHYAFHLKK